MLTAAHCGEVEWVLLGEHDITKEDGQVAVKVEILVALICMFEYLFLCAGVRDDHARGLR